MDIFLKKITQTSSQKSIQQSKIPQRSPQKSKFTRKRAQKINFAQKSLFNQKKIFFNSPQKIPRFESQSCIIGPYHQGCGPDSIEKDSQWSKLTFFEHLFE